MGARIASIVTLVALAAFAAPAAAQPKKPSGPVDPVQANVDVRDGAKNLDNDMAAAMKQLQKDASQVANLRDKWKDASKKGREAERLAEEALKAAKDACDDKAKKAAQAKIDAANKARDEAKFAKDMAEIAESGIRNDAETTERAARQRIGKLNDLLDNGMDAAKKAGYKDNSVVVNNLNTAKTILDAQVQKVSFAGTEQAKFADKGSLAKVQEGKNLIDAKLKEIKKGLDPADDIKKTDDLLKQAKEYLGKDCPPKTGAMAPAPRDGYAIVDNRPQALACIAPGQDVGKAINQLGIQDGRVVADTPAGTVVRTPTDAKTIEKTAKEKNITLCFPPEGDFCTIMTPLTPFRGHDHAAHERSGRLTHDHDGPNPDLDWGVEPPVPTITLESAR
jgi:Skp family chaperone for outer membrane proteins